ncbi:MAG: MlaD family protein [Mariniblastus sp.]
MDERILKFRVGILVVISMLILGILILTISGKPFFGSSYQISGETEDAAGISSGTPIKKFGLPIGRVTKVAPSPNGEGVTVWMSIQESDDNGQKQMIDTSKEMAVIGSESILGDVVLNIVSTDDSDLQSSIESEIIIKKNNPIEAVLGEKGAELIEDLGNLVGNDTEKKLNLRELANKIDQAAGKITEIIGAPNDESNNLFTTIKKIQTTSDSITSMFQRQENQPNFADAIANFDNLLGANGEEQTTFRGTLNSIDESIKDTSSSIQDASDIAGNTLEVYQEIPKKWEGDVKAKVIELLGNTDEEVTKLLDNANKTVLSYKPNPESLIGKALTDEELGKNIAEITRTTKDIVENKTIESILVKLDLLLTDLRFFGDSLARNPGSIARGALRPRNDIGPKSTPNVIWEEEGYFRE